LHAELEYARWLVHGTDMRLRDVVDDAAALLESLSDGLRSDDLRVIASYTGGVDSALDVLDRTPDTTSVAVDTSMQTDAYRPEDLWLDEEAATSDHPDTTGRTDDGDESEPAEGDARAASGTTASQADTAALSDAGESAAWDAPTQDLTEVSGVRGSTHSSTGPVAASAAEQPSDIDSAEEAQRAARAALQRWTSSDSE
jgi:hypothetical protein